MPQHVFVHGFLLMRDASGVEHKMSKSLGNVLDPFEVMETFGTDALRYYLFREVSFGQDGGVSTITFGERYESELANELGNLASRTLSMITRYRDGRIPDVEPDAALAEDFDGLTEEVCRLLDGAEITQALDRIWQRVRRLNRFVEERAPWQLAKDEANAAELDRTLRALAEGLRVRDRAADAVHPRERGEAAARARPRGRADRRRELRRRARRRDGREAPAAVPQAAVIDSHTHLDRGPAPEEELLRAAREAGIRRILTVGIDAPSRRAALAAAEQHEDVFAAIGHHPNNATGYSEAITDELREQAAHPRCLAIGETGLDDYRDYAPRPDQERAFHAHIGLARELGKPLVIHTRAADDDTIATLAAEAAGRRGDPALLLDARPRRRMPRPRLVDLVRRQRHLPQGARPRARRRPRPARPAARRDRRAVPDPAARAQAPQPARVRRPHGALPGRAPAHRLRRARGRRGRERRPAPRLVSDLPAQPSLRRMRQFGIRPNRELGQNFLIDSNILDVIGRAAALGDEDVVLEVGGGLGVLSEYLAARTAHVHVVELDRRLEPPLRDALDGHPNTTLHLADAVKLDLEALDPAPTKVVANLPYGVAATVILRTVEQLPAVTTWVAMVQREVGERFAAKPGSAAYGVPSVLAQLACDVKVLRPVARTVFHPVPNVDSVLVGLTRTGPAPEPDLRALVQRGFAHRRKALARSVSLAPQAPRDVRDRVRAALEAMGRPADARAESLAPADWRELYERLRQDDS